MNDRTHKSIDGWLVIDKPMSMRCMAVTTAVRRMVKAKKVGHAGTLDPLAEGVLPIAIGRATKMIPYLIARKKTYVFTLQWGAETDTLDSDGRIIRTDSVRPDEKQIKDILPRFVGTIWQQPPLYSALHVNGVRAHHLARQQTQVDLIPRQVRLYHVAMERQDDADHATFSCVCGQGFYVRALARDIGYAVGGCAHVTALRRTAMGALREDHAIGYQKLWDLYRAKNHQLKETILPLTAAFDDAPE